MATLVLGAVGTLVGGPIGGAIGSLLGNLVDRTVLGPKRQVGPRLGDLSIQTSSYGSQIPKLFGTMRMAGTVIWATDLRESTHSSGGGKAGGSSTSYSYSASFAVALSARPILSVARIWADGNLLRSASGEWKADTGFRLYTGTEDQPIDPLIASAEGIGATPAHRGLAYAVFENLQLADFGNRIPSLTFEVTADPTDITVSLIAAMLTGGALAGEGGVTLGGFAASGEGVRDALSSLVEAVPLSLDDDGTSLQINSEAIAAIDPAWAGADPDGGRQPTRVRDRQAAAVLPDAVALRYYEPVRDYQTGLQRARRDGVGRRETALDLPVAIEADAARALAEAALSRAWVQRDTATLRLPWAALPIRVGTLVTLADGSRWRVASATLERMALELTLRPQGGGVLPATGADPGRAVASPDAPAGRTVPLLVDLPMLDDTLATAPRLWLAAAGTGEGWRRAAVSLSLDGGASWRDAGGTALPATIGHAVTALGGGAPDLFDGRNSVEVELLHGAMALVGIDDAGLVNGGNLALLGAELLQFGSAIQLSETRWRLSRLVRGRRGTEWAIGGHVPGEPFLVIDAATLLPLDVSLAAIGTTATVSLIGPGDAGTAAVTSLPITGAAVRPPAPVHVTAVRRADGGIRLDWVRRSRLGWPWLDGGEVPLGEDGERYRLELRATGASVRTVEVNTPFFLYEAANQAVDGAANAPSLTVTLAMLGTSAASLPPATFDWTW